MPWGDRTGPWGLGPMTGRAAGYCAGYPFPGYANPYVPGWGRGRGRGFWGRGRSFRWRFWAPGPPAWSGYGYGPYATPWGAGPTPAWVQPPTKEQEAQLLKDQQEALQQQLEEINQRLQELSTEKEK